MITFGALVGLMVAGTDESDTVRGVVREIDEQGAVHTRRVARRGPLVRVETGSGEVTHIVGERTEWWRSRDREAMQRRDEEPLTEGWLRSRHRHGLVVGGERPSWAIWDDTDFTRPTGPVRDTEFLGRPACVVELAPPARKPYPLEVTVDAATGLVLRTANAGFGSSAEWTEVEIGVDVPDELFVWDGPSTPMPTQAQRHAEHETEMADRRAWLAGRGIDDLPLPASTEFHLHRFDDATGSIYASVEVHSHATLLRRPLAGDPHWEDADELNHAHVHRWSDERWDWCLALDEDVSDEWLAATMRRLADST